MIRFLKGCSKFSTYYDVINYFAKILNLLQSPIIPIFWLMNDTVIQSQTSTTKFLHPNALHIQFKDRFSERGIHINVLESEHGGSMRNDVFGMKHVFKGCFVVKSWRYYCPNYVRSNCKYWIDENLRPMWNRDGNNETQGIMRTNHIVC